MCPGIVIFFFLIELLLESLRMKISEWFCLGVSILHCRCTMANGLIVAWGAADSISTFSVTPWASG